MLFWIEWYLDKYTQMLNSPNCKTQHGTVVKQYIKVCRDNATWLIEILDFLATCSYVLLAEYDLPQHAGTVFQLFSQLQHQQSARPHSHTQSHSRSHSHTHTHTHT